MAPLNMVLGRKTIFSSGLLALMVYFATFHFSLVFFFQCYSNRWTRSISDRSLARQTFEIYYFDKESNISYWVKNIWKEEKMNLKVINLWKIHYELREQFLVLFPYFSFNYFVLFFCLALGPSVFAFLFDLKITNIWARLGRFLGTERLDQTDSFSWVISVSWHKFRVPSTG